MYQNLKTQHHSLHESLVFQLLYNSEYVRTRLFKDASMLISFKCGRLTQAYGMKLLARKDYPAAKVQILDDYSPKSFSHLCGFVWI